MPSRPARTWLVMLGSLSMAVIGFANANINLFGLNAFYANRLVRCYLGASRPREAPTEVRPNFAPTNSPGPVRRPNPITGFDRDDDFPLGQLAIVHSWGGSNVRLMPPVEDASRIRKTGRDLIIVAAVGDELHFRVFGSTGNVVIDTDGRD